MIFDCIFMSICVSVLGCVYPFTESVRYSIRSLCISKEKHKTLAKTNNFTKKTSEIYNH